MDLPSGRPLILLLVEDNQPMRELVRSLLADLSPVVHACESGEAAVDAYASLRPDCVLMDIEMEGMGGIAATRAIRRLDPRALVIMVTGHGQDRYRRAAASAGAGGFVLKEDLLELPTVITACLAAMGEGPLT